MSLEIHYITIMSKNTRRTFSRLKPAGAGTDIPSPKSLAANSRQQKTAAAKSEQPATAKKKKTGKPAARQAGPISKAKQPSRATHGSAVLSPPLKPWTPAEVREAFVRFRKANPEPKGELKHLNPYTLLVAVVLSAQATDAGVNKATRALFAIADTPARMLALGEEKVRDYIKTIGLYRTKARNIIALSEKLLAEFDGEVPHSRVGIESLPGAGRKTANVVLNMAFGEHTMAVDTHVFRVANRTGMAPGKTPLDVELGLERVIPDQFMLHAHHWLILHGRYTCLARSPRCTVCLINDLCLWPEKALEGSRS
jgi:endonuclease III